MKEVKKKNRKMYKRRPATSASKLRVMGAFWEL